MAAQKDTDNPFSFKKFVSKREVKDESTGKKVVEGGGGGGRRKKVSKKEDVMSPFPEVEAQVGARGKEDNPFSFKKFVKKKEQQTNIPSSRQQRLSDSFSSDEDDESHSVPLIPPLNPPLVVDPVINRTDSLSQPSSEDEPTTLPVLGILSASTAGPFADSEPTLEPLSGHLDSSDDEGDIISAPPRLMDSTDRQILVEVNELRRDKEQLQLKLQKAEKRITKEQNKCQSLKDEIKRLKEKEAADTKALEEIVQKVEKNLLVTTERAVKAESTIMKLQQEIKTLQGQLAQASPQAVHQHYEELLAGVREKATFASQQLHTAAHKADLQIKELLLGVETLKTVSEVLVYIDRVSAVKDQ